jgi:hypothetical protein
MATGMRALSSAPKVQWPTLAARLELSSCQQLAVYER